MTLSLPCCHLKANNSAKVQLIKPFLFSLHKHVKGFPSRSTVSQCKYVIGLENMLLGELCVCVCTFQPTDFTGWGSEYVNKTRYHQEPSSQLSSLCYSKPQSSSSCLFNIYSCITARRDQAQTPTIKSSLDFLVVW